MKEKHREGTLYGGGQGRVCTVEGLLSLRLLRKRGYRIKRGRVAKGGARGDSLSPSPEKGKRLSSLRYRRTSGEAWSKNERGGNRRCRGEFTESLHDFDAFMERIGGRED